MRIMLWFNVCFCAINIAAWILTDNNTNAAVALLNGCMAAAIGWVIMDERKQFRR